MAMDEIEERLADHEALESHVSASQARTELNSARITKRSVTKSFRDLDTRPQLVQHEPGGPPSDQATPLPFQGSFLRRQNWFKHPSG